MFVTFKGKIYIQRDASFLKRAIPCIFTNACIRVIHIIHKDNMDLYIDHFTHCPRKFSSSQVPGIPALPPEGTMYRLFHYKFIFGA